MLSTSTYNATDLEREAVDALIGEHSPDGLASVTRRDPGETGPLQVEIAGRVWTVDEDGNVEEVS